MGMTESACAHEAVTFREHHSGYCRSKEREHSDVENNHRSNEKESATIEARIGWSGTTTYKQCRLA